MLMRVNLALQQTKVEEEHDFHYTATVYVIPCQLGLIQKYSENLYLDQKQDYKILCIPEFSCTKNLQASDFQ